MCFRPSTATNNSNLQMTTCPNCGEPAAYQAGTTEGVCPYCKTFIPPDPSSDYGFDPNQNYRIL